MRRLTVAALAALTSFACVCAQAYEKPPFPRLGGIKISSPQNYQDPAYQEALAKLDLVVLNNFPGWEKMYGTSMKDAVAAIKSRNPKELVFTYVDINELPNTSSGAWAEVWKKLSDEKWWLYPQGVDGLPVVSTWGTNFGITNYTMGARPDKNGQRFLDWYPQWANQKFFANVPNVDGVFTDNFFWKPRVDGDWDRDGRKDSAAGATAQKIHREGMRKYVENFRRVLPGKLQIGNIGGWGDPDATFAEYQGLLNGGVLERYIGYSWSPEGQDWQGVTNKWGSWKRMMDGYRKVMASVAEPKLVIFMQYGDPKDYQAFRYGLASCLMDDGYFDFAPKTYGGMPAFDEYDAKLGQATSKPPTASWKNGVWRRDFEKGIALVNPRGNGPQTVDLGGQFKRIAGKQATSVNDGSLTRQVTLKDRDGIILLRETALKRPQPPKVMTSSTGP
jgi:putative glycosyl hydrolase-like family 15 (GHL15) protein